MVLTTRALTHIQSPNIYHLKNKFQTDVGQKKHKFYAQYTISRSLTDFKIINVFCLLISQWCHWIFIKFYIGGSHKNLSTQMPKPNRPGGGGTLRGFSPQANYTDRATAACRQS
jgi:hypothetical protein